MMTSSEHHKYTYDTMCSWLRFPSAFSEHAKIEKDFVGKILPLSMPD